MINDFTYKWLLEQKRRTQQVGIESEYVIPAGSGRMVKESSLACTFRAFCKNDVEDNLAIQNEIFKIYDFDFGGGEVEAMFA